MKSNLAMVVVAACILLCAGCPSKPAAPKWPTQVAWPDQVMIDKATATGTSAWLTTFSTPVLRLGACATAAGVVTGKPCLQASPIVDTTLAPKDLSAGQYQYFSRLMSIDFNTSVSTAAASGAVREVYESRQLLMQWARWDERSAAFAPNEQPSDAYVDKVRVGVGARMTFDVVVSRTEAETKANFGFGEMAAALAAKKATARVSLSVVGFPQTVLPKRSPVVISSASEWAEIVEEFYQTVRQLNELVASQTESLDGDVLAYHVVNMSTPTLNAAYAAGYVWGLKAIAAGKVCNTALTEAKTKVSTLSADDNQGIKDGMAEVYAVFTAAPGCGNYPVGEIAKKQAHDVLQVWSSDAN